MKFTNFREVLGFKIQEFQRFEIFVYLRFGSWWTPRESKGGGITVQVGTDEKQGMKFVWSYKIILEFCILFLTSKL